MKNWLVVAVVVLVGGGIAYGLMAGGEGRPVQTAVVETGTVREFVDERGKTRLPKVHVITMPFTARIAEITLQEGDTVKAPTAGDKLEPPNIIAQVMPIDLKLSTDAAQAAVDRLDASIAENDDVTVEKTGHQQAEAFVESMDATVASAKARMEAGLSRANFAEVQLGRTRDAFRAGGATQEDLDRANVLYVEAKVDYRQDQLVHAAMVAMQTATDLLPTMVQQYIDRKNLSHNVLVEQREEAQVQLARTLEDNRRGIITSPVDGVVLSREIANERYITAGTELMTIGQLDKLQVEVDVLSQDVVDIKPGQTAEVYGAAIGSQPAGATVARIYPAGFTKVSSLGVEQQRVKVVLEFDPADLARLREQQALGVDYRVRAKIFTAESENTLVVPRSALFRGKSGDGNWQLFVVRDGAARLTDVTVGKMNDRVVEIGSGLEAGATVILAPETDLADGTAVRSTNSDD